MVGSTITVGNVAGLQHARSLTNLLNKVANWLPWVGLVLLAGGVLLSRRKRRALVASLLGLVVGLVLVGYRDPDRPRHLPGQDHVADVDP